MAYLNSNNNIVLRDEDNDGSAWSNGAVVTGLTPNVPINISIVSSSGSTDDPDYVGVSISKYVNNSWDYYDTFYLRGVGSIVTVSVNEGENLVLHEPEDDVMEVSLVYYAEPVEVDIYAQPSIVPAAVSSQLDVTGEERIHIAPYEDTIIPKPIEVCTEIFSSYGYNSGDMSIIHQVSDITNAPSWFEWGETGTFLVQFPEDTSNWGWYYYDEDEDRYFAYKHEYPVMWPGAGETRTDLKIAEDSDTPVWTCMHLEEEYAA